MVVKRVLPLFLVSVLLHGLLGWWLSADLTSIDLLLGVGFQVFLVLSSLLLPLALIAPRVAPSAWSPTLTWLGLIFMGGFSSLFVLSLLRGVALVAVTLLNWTWPGSLDETLFRSYSALAVPVVGLLMTIGGFWNARRTAAVVQVDVPILNLPHALHGFTVAQITDIHVGPTIKKHYLQRIVNRVNSLNADLVAITGDLVDGSVHDLHDHVLPLRGLTSTHGTFFVTGNHEYYSGAHSWIAALGGLGVRVLMNEHVLIHHGSDNQDTEHAMMVVAGVTDYGAHHFDDSHRSDPHAAMADAPEHALFKLLLAHQPRSAPAAAKAGFDLQLSGHTHGGQFWPWNHFVRFQQPFTAGLHKLEEMWVYTSRGTGYWGPPKRFGAPSEITHLRLVRV
ncbi:metallophosphoesterase [Rhodoferax sp. PAMC 29310]|uniref:metallophosphoesterase n=1 Tax=Rhodoferax sp. PAMC 29310 TaxID=2822760 RepID=UPI001B33DB8D